MRRKDSKRGNTHAKRSGMKRHERNSVSIHFESPPAVRYAGAAAPSQGGR